MEKLMAKFLLVAGMLMLGGCSTMPKGPSVMVLPGPDKSFQQFNADDVTCRQWAAGRVGTSPQESATRSTAKSAGVGTALGAGLGAAIGAASGHAGSGAAIGAGSGLLLGTASGAGAGESSGQQAQRQYDIAYQQCMYANGNQIPGVIPAQRPVKNPLPPPPPR